MGECDAYLIGKSNLIWMSRKTFHANLGYSVPTLCRKIDDFDLFHFRMMFWTDWGSTPKIERASLAGLNRTVLVNLCISNQYLPFVIFVDYIQDRIYWADALIDGIDSTDLNGNNRRLITNPIRPSYNMRPFDFTVYDGVLYWSDWKTYSIEKLNWTTGAYLGGFGILTSYRVFGLALLHQSRQPTSAGKMGDKV